MRIFYWLYFRLCSSLQCLKSRHGIPGDPKSFKFECKDTIDLSKKCDVWNNEDAIDLYYTPIGKKVETLLNVTTECYGSSDYCVEQVHRNGTRQIYEHFKSNGEFPSIKQFLQHHEGRYRCRGVKTCKNGTVESEEYIFDLNLEVYESSEPDGVVHCGIGCPEKAVVISERKIFQVTEGSNVVLYVQVIYPPCDLLTPKWYKDSQFVAESNTLVFDKLEKSDAGNYTCWLENKIDSVPKRFELVVNEPSSKKEDVIIGIGIGILITVISVAIIVLRKCHQASHGKEALQPIDGQLQMKQIEINPLLSENQTFAQQFTSLIPPYLQAQYADLGGSKHWIGSGHFGEVYLCTVTANQFPLLQSSYDEKRRVAVKTWKYNPYDTKSLESIVDELNIMITVEKSRVHYQDGKFSQFVIQLIGCGLTPGESFQNGYAVQSEQWPFLVLEYAENGDLLKFLREHKKRSRAKQTPNSMPNTRLSYADLTKFSYQISCGMVFLTENKIVHRDLAARNILISSDFTMKISDFGLSKEKDYYISCKGNKLPWKWMAIESIQDHKSTVYTDVWSFGITMWEIFTLGNQPYPTKSPDDVRRYLEEGKRLERPQHASQSMYRIMKDCWKQDPMQRPKFRQLSGDLENQLSNLDNESYVDMSLEQYNDSDSRADNGQGTPHSSTNSLLSPPVTPRTNVD